MVGLADSLNLVKKTTPARAWNALRVLTGFYYSRLTRRPGITGMPTSLSIEPTTSCNLRCPECPSGLRSFTRPTGMLDEDLFISVLDQLQSSLQYLTFYFQGEPYLHPKFLRMVSLAASRGIYTTTSTNGHFLRDDVARETVLSGLDRLIISIDGTTQETYEAYRVGGTLEKVLTGTQNVVTWKRRLGSPTPHIVFQFLVVKPNEHQVDDVHRLAREMGVDQVALKTAQINDFVNGSRLIPSKNKYSRYRQTTDGTYVLKNRLENQCWKMWHSSVITWDGRVAPCCFDKDVQHPMGALNGATFRDIWYGSNYRNFRKALLKSRREIDICKNCTEGTKVWA